MDRLGNTVPYAIFLRLLRTPVLRKNERDRLTASVLMVAPLKNATWREGPDERRERKTDGRGAPPLGVALVKALGAVSSGQYMVKEPTEFESPQRYSCNSRPAP